MTLVRSLGFILTTIDFAMKNEELREDIFQALEKYFEVEKASN